MEIICIVLFISIAVAFIIAIQIFCLYYFNAWVETLPSEEEKEKAWKTYNMLSTAKSTEEMNSLMWIIGNEENCL